MCLCPRAVRFLPVFFGFVVCGAGGVALADDGAWLERAAEQAVSERQYPRAVTLLRALAALRPDDPTPSYRLAEVLVMAGQTEAAITEYRRFAARPEADPARKALAESEATRLEGAPAPFVDGETAAGAADGAATAEARRLFDEGKRDAAARRYPAAVRELEAALLCDPELPGPYRLLGAVHAKIGDRAAAERFFAEYLRVRPDGRIADTVRRDLAPAHVLGAVTIEASFPCKIYVDGRDTGRTTPLRRYLLPPGRYVIGLENASYHVVRNLRVDVRSNEEINRTFDFGVLVTKLEPWARVRVDGKDIGLWDEAGVPAGRHHVVYRSHDGSRERTVDVDIRGGARQRLSW